ncbi:MAG: transaldolase / glucose-6-phosphate isomerase [Gammaproteobacteria bacterium]|nr:MAG: transaldolase / glucose-6-phosphate isomerase [Gammaproteobacteria bacterium]TND03988.1 MAG: transaldolase / glucose-6-phosphate isomerase [Gammaproteobacteria bacterium]
MNPLRKLQGFNQSIWYDNLEHSMIVSGELRRMISEDGLTGVTSNPTIFEKAINGTDDYDAILDDILKRHPDFNGRNLFFEMAIQDIRAVADLLEPVYTDTKGVDGYVSLEVSPDLAHDTKGTVTEARQLWRRVARPNLMIKVPATQEGLPAIQALIADGININVTLLFSVERYKQVINAYLLGLESRVKRGQVLNNVASVASFFVSRVDQAVDKSLDHKLTSASPTERKSLEQLKGKIAIANCRVAYDLYREQFASSRFATLRESNAQAQRLLWASTGTKNPALSDILYVSSLIGDGTVNTLPPATYQAFRDHGEPQPSLPGNVQEARDQLASLKTLGIDMDTVTAELLTQGMASFSDSFQSLLSAMESKAIAINQAAYTSAQAKLKTQFGTSS